LADKRPTVLVAEDEVQRNRRVLDALKREGFEVDTASTTTECVGKLRQRSYDVIVLDIMMPPGEDPMWQDVNPINAGVEFLTRWRDGEIPGMPEGVPVVVLTATTRHRAVLEALGIAAYLEKPCSLRDITAAVRTAAEEGGDSGE
jgi:CheY-like chemotaxis protein